MGTRPSRPGTEGLGGALDGRGTFFSSGALPLSSHGDGSAAMDGRGLLGYPVASVPTYAAPQRRGAPTRQQREKEERTLDAREQMAALEAQIAEAEQRLRSATAEMMRTVALGPRSSVEQRREAARAAAAAEARVSMLRRLREKHERVFVAVTAQETGNACDLALGKLVQAVQKEGGRELQDAQETIAAYERDWTERRAREDAMEEAAGESIAARADALLEQTEKAAEVARASLAELARTRALATPAVPMPTAVATPPPPPRHTDVPPMLPPLPTDGPAVASRQAIAVVDASLAGRASGGGGGGGGSSGGHDYRAMLA